MNRNRILTGLLIVGLAAVFGIALNGCETNAGDPDSPYPAIQDVAVGDYFRSEWSGQFIRYNGMIGPSMSFSTSGRSATNLYFPFDTTDFTLGRCSWKVHDWTPLTVRIEYMGGCDAYQSR